MKKLFAVAALALLVGYWLRAQTLTTYTIIHTGPLANCAPVVAGQTQTCYPVEGLAVSVKGAPYVLVPLSAIVAGVTQITINGGPAQTGPVALTIPTKATSSTTTTIQ